MMMTLPQQQQQRSSSAAVGLCAWLLAGAGNQN